jgi:hypothetical protein
MFADLPKPLQEKVLEHLQKNNFPAAKAIHDAYFLEHPKQPHLAQNQHSHTPRTPAPTT